MEKPEQQQLPLRMPFKSSVPEAQWIFNLIYKYENK